MNAQHSEVFKMAYYDLLECLVPPQCRRKVAKNLLFSAKMACFLDSQFLKLTASNLVRLEVGEGLFRPNVP